MSTRAKIFTATGINFFVRLIVFNLPHFTEQKLLTAPPERQNKNKHHTARVRRKHSEGTK